MKFNPDIHHRRSIRLKGYDYSQPGAYFITLVTQGRDCIFGEVIEGDMVLNWYGKTVQRDWMDLSHHYQFVTIDAFIVMPNHVHAIVVLRTDDVGRGGSTQAHDSKLIKFVSDRFVTPDVGQTRPYGIRRHGLPEIVQHSNHFPPGALTKNGLYQEYLSGNGIITNISSGINLIWIAFACISVMTHVDGQKIRRTRSKDEAFNLH